MERFLTALQAGIDRLDESSLLEGHAVGDFDQAAANDPVPDVDVFGEASAGGLKAGGARRRACM